MATQTCLAGEAPVVNHTASFDGDDSVSAKVALHSHELCVSGLPRIVGNSAALRRVLEMVRIVAAAANGASVLRWNEEPPGGIAAGEKGC